jgi:hypothetical protein
MVVASIPFSDSIFLAAGLADPVAYVVFVGVSTFGVAETSIFVAAALADSPP